jgi:hypothetical protein
MQDLEKVLGPGGWSWSPDLTVPMQSAYALVRGKEPVFTNYAKVRYAHLHARQCHSCCLPVSPRPVRSLQG